MISPYDHGRRNAGLAISDLKGELLDAAYLRSELLGILRRIVQSSAIIDAAPGPEWERLVELRARGDAAAERWRCIDQLIARCRDAAKRLREAEDLMADDEGGIEFTRGGR